MTLEEAIQLFDLVDDLVDTTDAVGIPTCCNLPVVQNSQDGISRIACLECGREIREVGRQWVVSDWGRKGISFLRLNAALTVEASREMARSSVPDNLEAAAAPAGLGGGVSRPCDISDLAFLSAREADELLDAIREGDPFARLRDENERLRTLIQFALERLRDFPPTIGRADLERQLVEGLERKP